MTPRHILIWLAGAMSLLLPGIAHADVSQAIVTDIPQEEIIAMFGKAAGSALTPEDSAIIAKQRFDGDTLRVVAILVEWSDRPGIYSRETIDSMLFSRNVYPTGSMADWFHENTYGQLTVSGDVIDWYNAGTYNPNFDFETILPALDAFVDFSQYDANGDNVADAVIFVRSGTGEEDSHDPNDIWSYAYIYQLGYGPGPFDGVMISRWNTSPELRPLHNPVNPIELTGVDTLNSIRVFCHETTHNLGYWDLYDYDDKLEFSTFTTPNDNNDHPVYDWDIMGYGGYGYFSIKSDNPSHMCGYTKMTLGFIEPTILTGEHQEVVIAAIETSQFNSLFKIPISSDGLEYFLLEYRNPRSSAQFDKTDSDFSSWFFPYLALGADTLDRGLLITHVDDHLPYWSNNGTPTYPHYRVAVEDAGYNPGMDYTSNPNGTVSDSAQWWYPFETRKGALFSDDVLFQDEFTPTSVPNSSTYDLGSSGVVVRVDYIAGDLLVAYVNNPNIFDDDGDGIANFADNCPGAFNPDQFNDDEDSLGNECDNCDSVSNPLQEDYDNDGFGNACDNCIWVFNPDQLDDDEDGLGNACDFPGGSPRTDTVATDSLRLVVRPDGNVGSSGGPGGTVNMDYRLSGDCDPGAVLYLFDGSPVIGHDDGGGPVADNCLFRLIGQPDQRLFPVIGAVPWLESQITGGFDVAGSGTFVSHDSAIGMDRTWYAPRSTGGDANFIIQRTRAYSYDGQPHYNLIFGEVVDFDVPSDPPVLNTGGLDFAQNLVYLRGVDQYLQSCQFHTARFGGLSLLATARYSGVGYEINSSPVAYGARTVLNSDVVIPNQGYPPDTLYQIMLQNTGFGADGSEADQHLLMTYAANETLMPGDTLFYFTVLITVHEGAVGDLTAAVSNARSLLFDGILPSCCLGLTGNVNGDTAEVVDLSDLIYLVNYLFLGGSAPDCMAEGNVDGDAECRVDLSDLIRLVNYLFLSGPGPAPCDPSCG